MATPVQVIHNVREMQSLVLAWRRAGLRSGLVPTMGALHAGHISLIHAAREKCDRVAATIFVNPTQFGPKEDFSKYPRTLDADLAMLSEAGCDAVFVPDREAMYPSGFSTSVEPPSVSQPLEGVCRPGHFRGVVTVVLKLFGIAPTDASFFGHKDYQQARVIQAMASDLNVPMEVHICPTVREPDGLAMSSRNRYLSPEERQRALSLWRALERCRLQLACGEHRTAELAAAMEKELISGVDAIEYAVVVDPVTLQPIELVEQQAIALIAAKIGTTRLIDNLLLSTDPHTTTTDATAKPTSSNPSQH